MKELFDKVINHVQTSSGTQIILFLIVIIACSHFGLMGDGVSCYRNMCD